MMNQPFSKDDFSKLQGSLDFTHGPGGPPAGFVPKMADISWVRRRELDVSYAHQSPAQRLDLYYPETGDGPFPVLLHIHGGGFGMGDKRDDHMDTYLKLLDNGIAVGSIEYRLGGEAIFPAAVLDCREAVRFVRANAEQYKIDPERIGVLGGSAGGQSGGAAGHEHPQRRFFGRGGPDV